MIDEKYLDINKDTFNEAMNIIKNKYNIDKHFSKTD